MRELTLGKSLSLAYGGRRMDRHGRLLAHLYDADGSWIQGAMLRRGMARVYSFSDNRSLVAEMLAIEGQARAARRGIWVTPTTASATIVRRPATPIVFNWLKVAFTPYPRFADGPM